MTVPHTPELRAEVESRFFDVDSPSVLFDQFEGVSDSTIRNWFKQWHSLISSLPPELKQEIGDINSQITALNGLREERQARILKLSQSMSEAENPGLSAQLISDLGNKIQQGERQIIELRTKRAQLLEQGKDSERLERDRVEAEQAKQAEQQKLSSQESELEQQLNILGDRINEAVAPLKLDVARFIELQKEMQGISDALHAPDQKSPHYKDWIFKNAAILPAFRMKISIPEVLKSDAPTPFHRSIIRGKAFGYSEAKAALSEQIQKDVA